MKDALDIHRALLEGQVNHEIVRLPRLIFSADELPDVLSLPSGRCLAVRVYRSGSRLIAVTTQAKKTPLIDSVSSVADVRDVTPAAAGLVNRITDYAADLVAPLLLPHHVRLFVDRWLVESVEPDHIVYTPTGDSGTALGVRLHELVKVGGATPADLETRAVQPPYLPEALQPTTQPVAPHTRRH